VGLGDRANLRITNFREGPEGSEFDLVHEGRLWGHVNWRLWGLYNARNAAMAALGAALGAGFRDPTALDLSCLARFRGVKRRQEVLADTGSLAVMTDFAHHPTAIRETLLSLRDRYPDRRLVLCFEARSNTACRRIHETAFELAFDEADEVHLGAVFRAERYPDSDRIDLPGMAARLGPKARAHISNEALEAALLQSLPERRETVIVFFSNGSFDGVPLRVAAGLLD
jgi:UDP-N-acetylmuramate: L-alanyl-gamma-D-glutamyl-meso-diaminopimelate ligase